MDSVRAYPPIPVNEASSGTGLLLVDAPDAVVPGNGVQWCMHSQFVYLFGVVSFRLLR